MAVVSAERLVTLLTDFGTRDYYVGAVKGTLLRLAPGATLVDLSHEIPQGDVEAASRLLAAAAPTFPPGTVHLAVVDPGVGSERRILAVGTAGHLFVAPDNGLLTPWLGGPAGDPGGDGSPPAADVRSVEREDLWLPAPGATFHGRDRFAPTAAALLRGEPPGELGPRLDAPVRIDDEPPRRARAPEGGEELVGRVVEVDHFGNLITNLPSAWLGDAEPLRVEIAGRRVGRRVACYAELAPGEPGLLPGSRATLELSLPGESLAGRWGVGRGEAVRIVTGDAALRDS